MYLEEFEQEFMVNDFVDAVEGEVLDLTDDLGESATIKAKEPIEEEVIKEVVDPVEAINDVIVKSGRVGSKMSQARLIYQRELFKGGPVKRATMIAIFMDEVGLTKAGASTYYQTISKEF
jgi:hypothetical protein